MNDRRDHTVRRIPEADFRGKRRMLKAVFHTDDETVRRRISEAALLHGCTFGRRDVAIAVAAEATRLDAVLDRDRDVLTATAMVIVRVG